MEQKEDLGQKEEQSFVRETIKERPLNKRKLFRRTITTVVFAVVFGMIACLTFLLIEPSINKILNPEKITKVEFPEEKQEISPQELLTEETVAQQEAVKDAVENVIENVGQELTMESYQRLYTEFLALARRSEKSVVTVIGISEEEDWFQGIRESRNTISGLIVAENGAQILILADAGGMKNVQEYYVRFCSQKLAKATLKQKDLETGLAIYAVDMSILEESTLKMIGIAELGSYTREGVAGVPVITIGSPQGIPGSLSYGMITSGGTVLSLTDAVYSIMMTDMNMTADSSGVIIDLDGKVLGIITQSVKDKVGVNTVSALSISELKKLIAKLSNDERRAFIGVRGIDVTDEAYTEMGVPFGAYVEEVRPQSPAMMAGIQNGDVIVQIGEETISSFKDYRAVVLSLQPQTIVEIKLMRFDGVKYNEMKIQLTTGEVES